MGLLISDGFYNSEVNSYTYYGQEPDLDTFHQWGHFTQIVWKTDTVTVGCWTSNCTSAGLQFPTGGGTGIMPYFTVCNYADPGKLLYRRLLTHLANVFSGNYVGEFTDNVIAPIGLPSIFAGYMCPTSDNCANSQTVSASVSVGGIGAGVGVGV